MKLTRRSFLSSSMGAAIASLPAKQFAYSTEVNPVRATVVAGDHVQRLDISSVMEDLGLAVEIVRRADLRNITPDRSSLLWIVSSTYPDPTELTGIELAVIEKFLARGKGVLLEFVSNFPGVNPAGPIHRAGVARLFVVESAGFADALPAGVILDPHDAVCLPLTLGGSLRSVVQIAKIAGVEKMDATIPPKQLIPGVVVGQSGPAKFAVAATSLSEFHRRQYAPEAHWKLLLRDLAVTLLPDADRTRVLESYIPLQAHTEPRRWVTPGSSVRLIVETEGGARVTLGGLPQLQWTEANDGHFEASLAAPPKSHQFNVRATRGKASRSVPVDLRVEDRRAAYRRTLDNNIRWFHESGVLLRPDGSLGVAEWISGPDIEGNRIPFGKRQGFSPERADCVFESALAFWLYGEVSANDQHKQIGRNMLFNVMDFQRLDADDEYYGLWYTRGREGPIFQDDEACAIMGALAGYRYTQKPMFLHRGRMAADMSAKVFAQGAPHAAETADPRHLRPSDRGQIIAAWLYAYGTTADPSYLNQAVPALRALVKAFPDFAARVPAHTTESSRFLLPLALAAAYTTDSSFTVALRQEAEYLVSRMVPCGAIQEQGAFTGSKVQGGDLSLIHDSSEPISDQLYTTSFAAMNFWIAYKATGDSFYLDNFFRIADFLVRIQIESNDRTINGGWMRGFDYNLWEYYGSNADQSWTAYCLETGWCNAIIDLALELYLLNDTFYEPRRPLPTGAEG